MANLRPFQIAILAVFGILAVVAITLLAVYKGGPGGSEDGIYGDQVVVWGPFDERIFRSQFEMIVRSDKAFEVVKYQEISPRSFHDTFVNAIAEGRSPDLVLLPASELVRQRSKLFVVPYEWYPSRDYRDTFVDGTELFARPEGIYALPAMVDPMVLYWNRDMFAANGLAQAPTTWEYIVNTVVGKVTKRDNSRNILQSAIAFGEVRNVLYAKEILLMLMMQSGSRLVYEDNSRYQIALNSSVEETSLPPLEAALQFFTNFSNSNSALYSWNRSKQQDRNAFIAEELAMYFGFGSEAATIENQNPNLNFDMATMPQGASATARRTYGEFYGYAIPKATQNRNGAYLVANVLANSTNAAALAEALDMAPVRRNLITQGTNDPFRAIIFGSALIARGWLDPNQTQTDAIFLDMVEDVTSGRNPVGEAAREAEQKIRLAF